MSSPISRHWLRVLALAGAGLVGCSDIEPARTVAPAVPARSAESGNLDAALRAYLTSHGFTGRIASTLESRLGRRIDHPLADLGRQLWFDPIHGLNGDNTCGGCHSPTNGFGDTQPIAIGIDNNRVVGPGRTGPRNQRRTPMAINAAFYPTLMWNSRFFARSGNPFDNSAGFVFPAPEGTTLSRSPNLLTAQAFIPPTERTEAAGFHFPGGNDDIRSEVVRRLNASAAYRLLFARVFPELRARRAITYDHFARAIAEFEMTLVFADAPIDRYARGMHNALTTSEKEGAVLFFGRAGCVKCHAVAGESNEMFSDFRQHVAGVPQIAPSFGNIVFDGPGADEDFADHGPHRHAPTRPANAFDRLDFRELHRGDVHHRDGDEPRHDPGRREAPQVGDHHQGGDDVGSGKEGGELGARDQLHVAQRRRFGFGPAGCEPGRFTARKTGRNQALIPIWSFVHPPAVPLPTCGLDKES